MTFEVSESPQAAVSRRNVARHSLKNVVFEWSDAVFESRLEEAMVAIQRSIFLRA
jgi:hypothetical protein